MTDLEKASQGDLSHCCTAPSTWRTEMNQDDIIAIAREAGMKASVGKTDKDGVYHPFINALGKDVPIEWLERFAALVAAAEREKLADRLDQWGDQGDLMEAAAKLRRLYAENEALKETLKLLGVDDIVGKST